MNKEEFLEITTTFNWIKVKKWNEIQAKELEEKEDFDILYEQLKNHHEKETMFLIEKVRELAKRLYENK